MTSLSNRETPQGRRYEVKVALADSLFLVLGCIGLALSFPPLIIISAGAHLVASFLVSVARVLWLVTTFVLLALTAGLLVAGTYAVQVLYYGVSLEAVTSTIQADWVRILGIAIVAGGIIGNLFAYPGTLDQLREQMDGE
jgi:hypothetical protein